MHDLICQWDDSKNLQKAIINKCNITIKFLIFKEWYLVTRLSWKVLYILINTLSNLHLRWSHHKFITWNAKTTSLSDKPTNASSATWQRTEYEKARFFVPKKEMLLLPTLFKHYLISLSIWIHFCHQVVLPAGKFCE